MKKGKILIAVPTFETIKPECFKGIYGIKPPEEYNLFFDYVKGYDCAKARNEIAKEAIEYDMDYILMVDSDIAVPRLTVEKLLECDSDVAQDGITGKEQKQMKQSYLTLEKTSISTMQ